MLAVLLALAAADAADEALAAARAGAAAGTVAVEVLPLPACAAGAVADTDALAGAATLRTRDPKCLAAALHGRLGGICPGLDATTDGVRLHCRTRRLHVRVETGAPGAAQAVIRELRGLPRGAADDAVPAGPYAELPTAAGAGAALRAAEEAVRDGRGDEAGARLRALLDGPERQAAALLLGDLASEPENSDRALAFYRLAAGAGVFGRLATQRLCELTGGCADPDATPVPYDATGLPPAAARELMLRAARAFAFLGRPARAMSVLLAGMEREGGAGACAGEARLCRRLAADALGSEDPEACGGALAVYLSLSDARRGWRAAQLARLAAEAAARRGAPVFAGLLLSGTLDAVAHPEREAWLLAAARYFAEAGENARLRVIVEYARSMLGDARLANRPWSAFAQPRPPPVPEPDSAALVAARTEGAPAELESARARLVLARARAVGP